VWKDLDSIDSGFAAWRNEDPDLQSNLDWISSQTKLESTSSNALMELTLPLRAYAYENSFSSVNWASIDVRVQKFSLESITITAGDLGWGRAGGSPQTRLQLSVVRKVMH
jgi:hypothetical protein